jgi:hypothetical protein
MILISSGEFFTQCFFMFQFPLGPCRHLDFFEIREEIRIFMVSPLMNFDSVRTNRIQQNVVYSFALQFTELP